MIKLGQLETWERLDPKGSRTLRGKPNRLVRLEVNSPGTATLWLRDEDGELTFLAAVTHADVVEFVTERGDITLWTPDDEVYLYTAEMETSHVVFEDPEIYTGLMERATRNPELEWMQYQSRVNIQRMLDQQQNEFDARLRELQEANRAKADDSGEGEPAPAPTQPKSDGGKSPPADGADDDDGGTGN